MILKLALLILTMFSDLIGPNPSESIVTDNSTVETSSPTSMPTTTTTEYVEVGQYDAQFLAATNYQRETPLQWSPKLAEYAEKKLYTQTDSPLFHSDISVLLDQWSVVGENLGVGTSVVAIQGALCASQTHYDNIVHPEFTHFGSATKEGNDGRLYTVHIYGG